MSSANTFSKTSVRDSREGRVTGGRKLLAVACVAAASLPRAFAAAPAPAPSATSAPGGSATRATAAPPALTDLQGHAVDFGQYRGRLVLVNFWATWCVPCRKEMPELDRLAAHVDPKRVAVLGVAADDADAVRGFVDKVGVHYPIAVAELDPAIAWSVALGNRNQGLPFSVLLDTQGRVLWQKSGGQLTEKEVSAAIAKLGKVSTQP